MDQIVIQGGKPLRGEIAISGAKNAALPLMAASLLSPEPLTLTNLPRLADISTMSKLLAQHGVDVQSDDGDGTVDGADNCPLISNADQSDADSDGIGDACESTPLGNAPRAIPVPTVPTFWLILGVILVVLLGGRKRKLCR